MNAATSELQISKGDMVMVVSTKGDKMDEDKVVEEEDAVATMVSKTRALTITYHKTF